MAKILARHVSELHPPAGDGFAGLRKISRNSRSDFSRSNSRLVVGTISRCRAASLQVLERVNDQHANASSLCRLVRGSARVVLLGRDHDFQLVAVGLA